MLNPNPALGWQAGVDLSSLSVHGHEQPLRASQRWPAHPHALQHNVRTHTSGYFLQKSPLEEGRLERKVVYWKGIRENHSSDSNKPIKRSCFPEAAWHLFVLALGRIPSTELERAAIDASGGSERGNVCLPLQSMNGAVLLLSW